MFHTRKTRMFQLAGYLQAVIMTFATVFAMLTALVTLS